MILDVLSVVWCFFLILLILLILIVIVEKLLTLKTKGGLFLPEIQTLSWSMQMFSVLLWNLRIYIVDLIIKVRYRLIIHIPISIYLIISLSISLSFSFLRSVYLLSLRNRRRSLIKDPYDRFKVTRYIYLVCICIFVYLFLCQTKIQRFIFVILKDEWWYWWIRVIFILSCVLFYDFYDFLDHFLL